MLYCLNNPSKRYTGKEPSPKGLGYCASGEKEGTEMLGRDGEMWIKKGNKWVKMNWNVCENVVKYQRIGSFQTHYGKEVNGKFYVSIGYNLFDRIPFDTEGYKKVRISNFEKESICGDKKRFDEIKWDKRIHKKCKERYLMWFDGSIPFLGCIGNKELSVYRVPSNVIIGREDKEMNEYVYSERVHTFHFDRIWVGIGKGGNIEKGNTFLLQDGGKLIFVGGSGDDMFPNVFSFTVGDDEVMDYYSVITDGFPDPVVVGKENVYLLSPQVYIPKKYFDNFTGEMLMNPVMYYYTTTGSSLKKYAKKLKVRLFKFI